MHLLHPHRSFMNLRPSEKRRTNRRRWCWWWLWMLNREQGLWFNLLAASINSVKWYVFCTVQVSVTAAEGSFGWYNVLLIRFYGDFGMGCTVNEHSLFWFLFIGNIPLENIECAPSVDTIMKICRKGRKYWMKIKNVFSGLEQADNRLYPASNAWICGMQHFDCIPYK